MLDSNRTVARAARGAPATGRPRIVQVIPSLRVAGLENVVAQLVEHSGPTIEHVVVTPAADGPMRLRLPEGVPVIAMGNHDRSGKWNALRMAALFRTLRPDIVHSRNWTCIDAIVGAWLARVPVVIHGEHGRGADDPEGRNLRRRRIRRLLSPLVTEFVTVSRDLARWLIEDVGIPARKVTSICNGVDTVRFSPGDREAARRAIGLPVTVPVIGTVGRLDPVKDQRGLLHAFAEVARRHQAILAIAGDGPCRTDLERLVEGLGLGERVRLLGERDDVEHVLRAYDLFLLTSLGEGISNTILEAMASGLPVIATRVGGNAELVADGETGTLVEPRSPGGLAAAITRYLEEPGLRHAHGLAGRQRAEADFSLAGMLDRYESLYRRLLASRTSR